MAPAAARMAGGAYQREEVYDHPRVDSRLLCGCGGLCDPLDHQPGRIFAHQFLRPYVSLLSLFGLSRCRYLSDVVVRTIYRQGQYLSRYHTYSLCHLVEQVEAEVS